MKLNSPETHYDVVVVGGGMVGASFAIALDQAMAPPLSILVVEAVDHSSNSARQPSFDARSTALSYGSRQILERMGLWPQLQDAVTPITEIQVSDMGHFGSTRLQHAEHGVDALGYVIENARMGTALNSAIDASSAIGLLSPARIVSVKPQPTGMALEIAAGDSRTVVAAGLVALADGGKSPICEQLGIGQRQENYEQHAIIANVAFESPHRNVAYERFTDTGPLAVLPLQSIDNENMGSLVWTVSAEQSQSLMAQDDSALLQALQDRFGNRLGRFTRIGKRFCYPLSLSIASEQVRPGLVLLGNVAHTLHPVAGQGLNLALRDIECLVEVLAEAAAAQESPGAMPVLQRYLEAQDFDQQKSMAFTDTMVRLFSSNSVPKVWARKLGLLSIDLLPPLKRSFADQAMGLK